MHVRVLGSAAGGGYPQWNCRCAVCALAWDGDPRVRPRTQSSLAVSADGATWFLLNASPDIKQQILQNPPLQPRADGRHSPIAGVILTNADLDHVAGLLTLREQQALILYATAPVLAVLAANPMLAVLDRPDIRRHALRPNQAVSLQGPDGRHCGLAVTPFAVPGKVALWLEETAAATAEDTIGLLVQADGAGRLAYIPSCAAVDATLRQRVEGAALLLFDGTLWRDDEMIRAGVGGKTGRRMGHISISGEAGALACWSSAEVERKFFLHINNTNPVLIEGSPERRQVEAAGWEIACDGQEFRL